MTNPIDTTVNRDGNVQITIRDGKILAWLVFEDIEDAKRFHRILGFQIERVERANAMKGGKE